MKKLYTIIIALLLLTSCALETPIKEDSKKAYEGTWLRTKESDSYYKLEMTASSFSIDIVIKSPITGKELESTTLSKGTITEVDSTNLQLTITHEIDDETKELVYILSQKQDTISAEWSVSGTTLQLLTANTTLNGTYTKQ
ncbi:MAG: hypothetical protein JXR64_12740 [Spirochaetales bacterium]|nr:hypothetical protein [Spirochaetales bacterium]